MPEIGGLILSGCSARLVQSNRVFPSVAPDLHRFHAKSSRKPPIPREKLSQAPVCAKTTPLMAHFLHYGRWGGVKKMLRKDLWNVAINQLGFVTVADARALGAAPGELARLHRRGKLERSGHGIYRFAELPVTANDEYMLATLWSNNSATALSHDTALAVYDLCDINPEHIHITVPRGHRVHRVGGEKYVVHKENIDPGQLGWWEGIRAVKVYTAIQQAIETGVSEDLVEASIQTARRQGRITSAEEISLVDYQRQRNGV